MSPDNVKYYDTRLEAIEAVNKGEADYSFGNPYSVSFYILQKNLDNLITIPEGQEERQYRIGLLKENELLLSVINKGILTIDENDKHALTLNAMSQVERELTIPIIMESYGAQILGITLVGLMIILYYFIQNIRAKNLLEIQNKRYLALAKSSNEYLYEYDFKTLTLSLAPRTKALFGSQEKLTELEDFIYATFQMKQQKPPLLQLEMSKGEVSSFRAVTTEVLDKNGHVNYVIGKLLDVSEDEAEKQNLLYRSKVDGLTSLYNATTTRNLVEEKIKNITLGNEAHAFMVFDVDKFELVNDTYGHLIGDHVLINIARALSGAYQVMEIIGRMGGDEFSVFLDNYSSREFIESKCEQFFRLLRGLNPDFEVNVSVGIAFFRSE